MKKSHAFELVREESLGIDVNGNACQSICPICRLMARLLPGCAVELEHPVAHGNEIDGILTGFMLKLILN